MNLNILFKAYSETRRILLLTRKPRRSEFAEAVKVTSAGIVLIGFIGFIIFLISRILS
jgi:protein transport protein SEC61 subunit gamma-like protein